MMPFACQLTARPGGFCLTSIKTRVENRFSAAHAVLLFVFWHQNLQKQKPRTMQAHSRDGWRGAESLTSEAQENGFSVLSFQSLPLAWNPLASASPTHTQLFLALQMLGSENHSFWSCSFKSNQFLFGSSVIYAHVWAQSPSYTQAHTLERLGGGSHICH